MRFTLTINAEVERIQGKFASRDEIEEQLLQSLESADPGNLEGDNGGEYEVTSWEVSGG